RAAPPRARTSLPTRRSSDLLPHQNLGRRGPGGHADGALALEPLGAQVLRTVDQVAGDAGAIGELAQAVGVGAAARADDQQHVAVLEELLDRVLAVLGGVADVLVARR